MSRTVPYDKMSSPQDILWDTERNCAATGLIVFDVMDLEPIESKSSGKLGYALQSKAVEPDAVADQQMFLRLWIGSDDDPQAEKEETWTRTYGGKRFNELLEACQIAKAPMDDDDIIAAIKGQRFVGSVVVKTEPDQDRDGNPNPYAGRESNEVKHFYRMGEKEPRLSDNGGPRAGRPAARAAAPAPARPAAPPPKPTPRAAAPTRAAAPATASPKRAQVFQCGLCKQDGKTVDVPVAELQKHMAEVHPEDQ